jgi:phospholipase/carboxylesterase
MIPPDAAPRARPPRVLTIPAATPAPGFLLVVLHGVGASADDLYPIARAWSPSLPGAEALLPDGLQPFDGGGSGRQWFSLRGITDATRPALVRGAASDVSAWIDEQLAARQLGRERVVLVGFSQGSMLAMWLAVHRQPAPLAVVAYSGRFADDTPAPGGQAPAPVLIVHGSADPMIPVEQAAVAERELARRGAKVARVIVPGLGHGISPDGARQGLAFVREQVAGAGGAVTP